jgi:hypothetical protein
MMALVITVDATIFIGHAPLGGPEVPKEQRRDRATIGPWGHGIQCGMVSRG